MVYQPDADYYEELQDSLDTYAMLHARGLATDEELADYTARVERQRQNPPSTWRLEECLTIDEWFESFADNGKQKQGVARKQSDLIEKARERRASSI